ncbi:unnamed protein product, partial [Polarella glacialis]
RRRPWLWRQPGPCQPGAMSMLPLLVLCSFGGQALAESQYFEVLKYRGPSQCTRCQCLNLRSETCRESRPGFYLREKGCQDNQICTNCVRGNGTIPTQCYCENPPYSVAA